MIFSTPIVCDDIRREMGGKRSIIGAYASKLMFAPANQDSPFPLQKQLGIYLIAKKEDDDPPPEKFDCNIIITSSENSSKTKNLILVSGLIDDPTNPIIVFDFIAPFTVSKIKLPSSLCWRFERSTFGLAFAFLLC
ncbi:MAG: hypothetical protein ACI8PD_002221 [Nitrospinales bacterium]|jgi:hypothetical protein